MNLNIYKDYLEKYYNYIVGGIIILLLITDLSYKIYIIIVLIIIILLYNYEIKKVKINKYNEINELLSDIKKYKKYNPSEYMKGKRKLLHLSNILKNRKKYKHKNYQYDTVKFLISECLKNFNSILLNIPVNKYIDDVNYNKLKYIDKEFANICKKLHDYLYNELYDFGNETGDITYQSNMISNDIVESYNFYDKNHIY